MRVKNYNIEWISVTTWSKSWLKNFSSSEETEMFNHQKLLTTHCKFLNIMQSTIHLLLFLITLYSCLKTMQETQEIRLLLQNKTSQINWQHWSLKDHHEVEEWAPCTRRVQWVDLKRVIPWFLMLFPWLSQNPRLLDPPEEPKEGPKRSS